MPNSANLIIEDAQIGFRNFAGKEGMYNREGDRNFAIFLDEVLAESMLSDGWNVKRLKAREGDDPNEPTQAYIQVAVSYKGRPPKINMVTSRGKTPIGEDTVEVLDWVDIETADVILNPYEWSVNGKFGVKAYLDTLYVVIFENALDVKYARLEEERKALESSERLAIESGEPIRVQSTRADR